MPHQNHRAPEALSIGELSSRAGCPVETIRYHERSGYLPEAPRTESGRRVYGEMHVKRLGFLRRARELGFSLDRTRALLGLSEQQDQPCSEALMIGKAHLAEVRQRRV